LDKNKHLVLFYHIKYTYFYLILINPLNILIGHYISPSL
jgi:hypothetical protein